MQFSVRYILLFSIAICGVCAVIVSSLAVGLKDQQEINEKRFKQRNVLEAAGLVAAGEKITGERIEELFTTVEAVVVDLSTGEEVMTGEEAVIFDQQKEKKDPATSTDAPSNNARVFRLPNRAQVFKLADDNGNIEKLILPIEGYGLWGTLYGFIAMSADLETVEGITYYDHKETPGLGGEVDNPQWKALWPGRKAFGDDGSVEIEVIKGQAGKPADDPYRVDGLAGATITSRGVTNMLTFWLGDDAFGTYLEKFRDQRGAA